MFVNICVVMIMNIMQMKGKDNYVQNKRNND